MIMVLPCYRPLGDTRGLSRAIGHPPIRPAFFLIMRYPVHYCIKVNVEIPLFCAGLRHYSSIIKNKNHIFKK